MMPLIRDFVVLDTPAAFLNTWNALQEPVGLLFAAWVTQCEVLNGGFAQFFWNSTGVVAPEAVRGFRALGQPKTAETLQRALARFGPAYLRDDNERRRIFPDPVHPAFDDLTDEFVDCLYAENGGFDAAADEYLDRFGIRPPTDRS
jgi:hypothetical protein